MIKKNSVTYVWHNMCSRIPRPGVMLHGNTENENTLFANFVGVCCVMVRLTGTRRKQQGQINTW